MKITKKVLAILLALAMVLSMAACTSSEPAEPAESGESQENEPHELEYVRMSAGPSGGFNYTLFAGIADTVAAEFPGYYDCQVDISTGTSENVRNIVLGEAQFGMVGLDVVKDAWNATGEFEGLPKENLYHIISGPSAIVHIMAPANSSIETLEDLVGKKIGVGKGVMETYLPIIFEAAGIDYTGTEMKPLTIADMINGMTDGTIDAAMYGTPYPTASISDFAMTTGLKLIEIPHDIAVKACENSGFFYETTIPADAYQGLTKDTNTVARRSAIMTNKDTPEEMVYNFLKVIIEKNDVLTAIHANAADLNLENALSGMQTPLHPGAEKYYKEIGLIQ